MKLDLSISLQTTYLRIIYKVFDHFKHSLTTNTHSTIRGCIFKWAEYIMGFSPQASTKCTIITINITSANFINPYSVRATNPMGMVEMRQPATGMNEHRNTKRDKKPSPGILSSAIPMAVSRVLMTAIMNCSEQVIVNYFI